MIYSQSNWTPLHCAIHAGHSLCLDTLLSFQRNTHGNHTDQILDTLADDVINMVDKDGWTVAFLATINESKVRTVAVIVEFYNDKRTSLKLILFSSVFSVSVVNNMF